MTDRKVQADATSATEDAAAKNTTAEDLLKEQTVGLVTLADFRKRRAEIAEQKERIALQVTNSGRSTPQPTSGVASPSDGSSTPKKAAKKRKKAAIGGKLSFGMGDDDDDEDSPPPRSKKQSKSVDADSEGQEQPAASRHNNAVGLTPRAMTKAALAREAASKEKMRKDFLAMRELVRGTEVLMPFVFYDGTDTPGGKCRIKKGSPVWLFLDKARKVGAEMGSSGADKTRRDWARISVDDLILVRDSLILPPHFEFFYFIDKAIKGPSGTLFEYSSEPRQVGTADDNDLEGADHDPSLTKVVDRRWYEKNKHIYPASIWQEYSDDKDYSKGSRRDPHGNAFFFA